MDRQVLLDEWPGSIFQRWAYNYCRSNSWRVSRYVGDTDDCMSECAVVYVECRHRYGGTITTPQQFMRLYQLCTVSWFNTLSVKDHNFRKVHSMIPKRSIITQPEAPAMVALNQDASSELKSVVKLFFSAPQEIMELLRAEASSSEHFFRAALKHCGIAPSRAKRLTKELQSLLTG